MKKIIAFFISIFIYSFSALPSFAQSPIQICPTGSPFGPLCALSFENFGTIVGRIIILLLIIAVIVSVFFLIYGGIKWTTSGGDKTAVEGARNHIVAAIVGLIISLLAFFIINFVGSFFGLNLGSLTLPKLP
ncbi:MAG: hypothetical protein ABH816_01280 [Candidatus Levyibacteriota bacterium]